MNYKYSEFSEDEYNHWCNQYGGTFVYPIELEVGTKFRVENGNWYGEVIEVDGEKHILTDIDTKIRLTPNYYLWVAIGKTKHISDW